MSVSLRERQFNVILGPNGAGKSTLLKIATGLAHPTTGTVRYADVDVATLSMETLAKTRAVLSQHIELAFSLSVEDVVQMGRYPHYGRVPTRRDRDIVGRALEIVGMTDRRAQPYPTLSGGERQKVQLARVLAQIWNYDAPRTPKYLFLDEPTSSLDIHYQIHLLDVARGLLDFDCTVVAILHDVNVALHYGDYFVLLSDGRSRPRRRPTASRRNCSSVSSACTPTACSTPTPASASGDSPCDASSTPRRSGGGVRRIRAGPADVRGRSVNRRHRAIEQAEIHR